MEINSENALPIRCFSTIATRKVDWLWYPYIPFGKITIIQGDLGDGNALKQYICIFGHTPTSYIRGSTDNSVWYDPVHHDKICIDCGCVYGGYLAAIRLDDGAYFIVNSKVGDK